MEDIRKWGRAGGDGERSLTDMPRSRTVRLCQCCGVNVATMDTGGWVGERWVAVLVCAGCESATRPLTEDEP
jgi:hypothetical protein